MQSALNKLRGWIDTSVKLPAYGSPVLIVINGVVQHITYMLDGADDVPDWFEPYRDNDLDTEDSIWYHKVDAWMPLPEYSK